MTDLRSVTQADVWKAGELAARLTRTADGVEFRYLTAWLTEHRTPVATSLPLSSTPVLRPGGALPAFFTGLLPEGRRLGALRRQVKTSADDELSLLLAVGANAVGDVQVVPTGQPPQEVSPHLVLDDTTRFTALLAELGIVAERTALPGVQDKVSAAMLNLAVTRRGERFLLKLTPPEFPHLVANEFCFLTAAGRAGLRTAPAILVTDVEGVPGLLLTRFDRRPEPLAVEDACQVLGLPPADKYRVTCEQALGALAAVCAAPLPAARTLLTQLAFAYLTGNGDAHAKNFAVVKNPEGEWFPSPAYDLPSSQPYGDSSLALSVNGRSRDPGRKDFLALGASLGLPERASRRILAQQVERVDAWLPLLDDLPFDLATVRKLVRVVRHRRDRLRA